MQQQQLPLQQQQLPLQQQHEHQLQQRRLHDGVAVPVAELPPSAASSVPNALLPISDHRVPLLPLRVMPAATPNSSSAPPLPMASSLSPYGAVATAIPNHLPSAFAIDELCAHSYKSAEQLKQCCTDELREYYQSQNFLLEQMRLVENPDLQSDQSHEQHHVIRRAIEISNYCNAVLLCAQLFVFLSTRSLSMLAVFVDATLDMVSGLVVAFTWRMTQKRDRIRYPVGRSRLEPLGVIAMACLMTAATLVTIEQSIFSLADGGPKHINLNFLPVAILLTAFAIKAVLYAYCRVVDHPSVQALAEDHFNDCLSNSVSLTSVFVAKHFVPWVDPVGALTISMLIIRNWVHHTLEHFDQLVGKIASPHIHNLITFITCIHSPQILLVDTVRAYHVGNRIYAEVHVVLDADMPLSLAHDVGESLQTRIETLDEVERCFVHLDVEALHSPTIEHKDI